MVNIKEKMFYLKKLKIENNVIIHKNDRKF